MNFLNNSFIHCLTTSKSCDEDSYDVLFTSTKVRNIIWPGVCAYSKQNYNFARFGWKSK